MNRQQVRQEIQTALAGVRRAVVGAIIRGVVSEITESARAREIKTTGLFGQLFDKLEHMESFGFTASPLEGAETVILSVAGDPDHRIVISVIDRRHRPTELERGDSCQYDANGHKIHLHSGGATVSGSGDTLLNTDTVSIGDGASKALIHEDIADLIKAQVTLCKDPVTGLFEPSLAFISGWANLAKSAKGKTT